MENCKKYLKKNWGFILLGFLFLLLKIPSFFEPSWVFDEGIYSAIGHFLTVPHAFLYATVWDNKPPAIYLLYSFSYIFFGSSMLPLRIILFILQCSIFSLLFCLTKFWFAESGPKYFLFTASLLLCFFFFDGNIVNGEVLFMFFSLSSIFLLRSFHLEIKYRNFLFAGLLAGIAFLIKIPSVFDFCSLLFVIILFAFNNKNFNIILCKRLALSLVCFALPICLFYLFFLANHEGSVFLNAVFFSNKDYVAAFNHSLFGINSFYINCFFLVTFLTLVVFISKKIESVKIFLLVWFSCAYFAALLSGRPYFHYLLQAAIPFAMLFAYFFYTQKKKVIIFFVLTMLLSFYFYRNGGYFLTVSNVTSILSRYTASYEYMMGSKTKKSYYQSFGVGPLMNAYDLQVVAAIVNKENHSNTLFIWANEPWLYSQIQLRPTCVYVAKYYFASVQNAKECVISVKPKDLLIQDGSESPFTDGFLAHNNYKLKNTFPQYHFVLWQQR